mgnify:CR=1 FL=1
MKYNQGKSNQDKAEEPLQNYEQTLNLEQVWKLFMETEKQFRDTDKKFQETDKKFQETDKKFAETDRRMKEIQAMFTSQWGRLIETLVEGDLVKLLNERGINVVETSTRVKGNYEGKSYEFDIIAQNGQEVVVVEVKTTLKPDDVKDFLDKLDHFKIWRKAWQDNKVFGAMAFLQAHAGSERMVMNKGLFAIRATGGSASIINTDDFEPHIY